VSALPSSNAYAFKVQVGTAPENSLSLILGAIGSAKRSLLINIYEFTSPEITQAIIDRINHGVHVEMLLEGTPIPQMSAASRGLQAQIAQAMGSRPGCCRLVEMRKGVGGVRRFHYDHAKYIVIDQSALLLGSENYSPGGHPEPGTLGNRGWEVLIADPQPAQWFSKLFAMDSDPRQPDIFNLLNAGITAQATPLNVPMIAPARSAVMNPVLDATDGQIITSPDTSLKGTLALIQSARKTLDIEQMSFNMNWVTSSNNVPNVKGMSPIAQAIADAARRGVRVRILLNDEFAFFSGNHRGDADETDGTGDEPDTTMSDTPAGKKITTNRRTVQAFTQLAASERLPIEARIANYKAMGVAYIHNKGVIVDGKITLIGSINWTQNSITNNREAAVALKSPQIAAYFGQAFNQDWNRSAARTAAIQIQPQVTIREPSMKPVMVPAPEPARRSAPDVCPNGLKVSATIGDIQSIDNLDPSYLELARHTLNGNFVRNLRDKRCILLGQGNLALELRKDAQGNLDADLEGYTRSFKPFSIRAEFPSGSASTEPGKLSSAKGRILEGSATGGGRRRSLGLAVLSIQTP
jgi:phosphatidylserine/phosphatidylglycerophosphate/cardiolipin synthase-like enzyme